VSEKGHNMNKDLDEDVFNLAG